MLTFGQALRRSALVALGLAALAGTAAAQAQPDPNQPEQPSSQQTGAYGGGAYGGGAYGGTTYGAPVQQQPTTQPTYVSVPPAEEEDAFARYGIGVSLGGGVDGFTSNDMTDFTDVGGSWNVRIDVGMNSILGFEGLYIGSAQGIDAIGLDPDSVLVGNGVQGNVRLNLLDYAVQPFAFGGVAWRHYDLTNSDFNTSAIADSDDVAEFPIGAGIGVRYAGFTLDARGEYRWATGGDMVPLLTVNGVTDDANMNRWGVNANIGYMF
jgi:opacity protein-like surface antigen